MKTYVVVLTYVDRDGKAQADVRAYHRFDAAQKCASVFAWSDRIDPSPFWSWDGSDDLEVRGRSGRTGVMIKVFK